MKQYILVISALN